MARFRINMAKGYVVSVDRRRVWRRRLSVYFVLMLVLMAACVGVVAQWALAARAQVRDLRVQEERFLAQYQAGTGDMERHVGRLSGRLSACADRLEALSAFSPCECPVSSVLLGLARRLPVGMELGQVSVDGVARRVTFSVLAPVGRRIAEHETPPNLVAQWMADPLLAGRMGGLTAGKSERVSGGGTEVMVWQFSADLGGGK